MLCTDALAVPETTLAVPVCLIFLSQEPWKGSGLARRQSQPVTTLVCLQLRSPVAVPAVACLACPSPRVQMHTEFPGLTSNSFSRQCHQSPNGEGWRLLPPC